MCDNLDLLCYTLLRIYPRVITKQRNKNWNTEALASYKICCIAKTCPHWQSPFWANCDYIVAEIGDNELTL